MTPELPPLPRFEKDFHRMRDSVDGSWCHFRAAEARERILLARIAEAEEQRGQWAGLCVRLEARIAELEADAERLNYIERTFAGCTMQDRYLPIRMIWGKGCNGRTLREACDKYMKRDAAIDAARKA